MNCAGTAPMSWVSRTAREVICPTPNGPFHPLTTTTSVRFRRGWLILTTTASPKSCWLIAPAAPAAFSAASSRSATFPTMATARKPGPWKRAGWISTSRPAPPRTNGMWWRSAPTSTAFAKSRSPNSPGTVSAGAIPASHRSPAVRRFSPPRWSILTKTAPWKSSLLCTTGATMPTRASICSRKRATP